MIAAVIPFSLFTAYQFLSSDRRFNASESKMRPYPSCVYWRLCAYMMEMIATDFFFVYCVSNFEFEFYFQEALHTAITDAVYCVKLVVSDRRVANNVQIRCEMTWQIRFSKLQYNTCGERNEVCFSAPTTWIDHVIWSVLDHIVFVTSRRADHML